MPFKELSMFKKITLFFILFASFVVTSYAANGRFTLVIDAGHGGHDAGAIGAISKEKDINLNIALAFGRYGRAEFTRCGCDIYA